MKKLSECTWADQAKIDWANLLFLLLLHIGGLTLSLFYFFYFGLNFGVLALALAFYLISGLGITVGYHRLVAHQTFKVPPVVEFLLLLAGGMAIQNSALKWCYDHRLHHKFEDNVDDPYNINRGFWYAHMGWIIRTPNPKNFPHLKKDLLANPLVVFQDKHYWALAILSSLALPTYLGYLIGDAVGGFVVAGVLRIVIVHHFTFFINSLCHIWGRQPYSDKVTAKDNAVLAFFTYGEGYHNFHHKFQHDYRNGIKWYQFDPSKWVIQILSFFKLATSLKRASHLSILKAQLTMRQKEIRQRIDLLSHRKDLNQRIDDLIKKVEQAYRDMREKKLIYQERLHKFKLEKTEQAKQELKILKAEWQAAKWEYKMLYRQWQMYSVALAEA
ncbi:MAG: fatty acid desaturase [Bdellovibrionales bacterium]|nr:fatty acid desaturase [Bdellovibrionales bacterium]